jgi:hypothetical protein
LIPFVVSPEPAEESNHEWNPFAQRFPSAIAYEVTAIDEKCVK